MNFYLFSFLFALFLSSCPVTQAQQPAITLTFWCPPAQWAFNYWNSTIHTFKQLYPHIDIVIDREITWGNVNSRMGTAFANNSQPDLVWAGNTFMGNWQFRRYLRPLSRYYRLWKQEIRRDPTLDWWNQVPFDYLLNGEWWALPIASGSTPLFWRRDLVNQIIGVDRPPATYQELFDWALRINVTAQVWGYGSRFVGSDLANYIMPTFQAFGTTAFTVDLECGFDTAESRDAIQYLTSFSRAGITLPPNSTFVELEGAFSAGNMAFIIAGGWNWWGWASALNVSVSPLPSGPFGAYNFLSGEGFVIPAQSRYPDEAWTFARWFYDYVGGASDAGISVDARRLTEPNCVAEPLTAFQNPGPSLASILALPDAFPLQFPNPNTPALPVIDGDPNFLPALFADLFAGRDIDEVLAEKCAYMNRQIAILTEPDYPVWDQNEPFEIAFSIFLGICLLLCLIGAVLTFHFRAHTLIWIASPVFSGLIWFGCTIGYVALFFFAFPATQSRCLAKYWLGFCAFAITYGALFTKTWRLWRMVNSAMKFRVERISRTQTLAMVGLVISPVLLLLILWSAINTLDVEYVPVASNSYKQLMCTSDNYWIWQGLLFGYLTCLCLFGLYIAFASRKMSRGMSETRAINFSLLSSALIAVIVIPLVYGLEDSPEAVIILAVVGGGAALTLIWALLFGEKFYQIGRGKNPSRLELTSPVSRTSGSLAFNSSSLTSGSVSETGTSTSH